MYTPIKWKQTS